MRDEHDHYTQDMHETAKPMRRRKRVSRKFDRSLEVDAESLRAVQVGAVSAAYYVPVSHAASDWNVSPRRIRALLSAGRLVGQLRANGYWEVRFPYLFTFGMRGPSLKRHQRPPAKPKKPELIAV